MKNKGVFLYSIGISALILAFVATTALAAPLSITDTLATDTVNSICAGNSSLCPFTNFRTTFGGDGEIMVSADNVSPVNGRVEVYGTILRAGDQRVDLRLHRAFIGSQRLPDSTLQTIENEIESRVNNALASVAGLRIDSISITAGRITIDGNLPPGLALLDTVAREMLIPQLVRVAALAPPPGGGGIVGITGTSSSTSCSPGAVCLPNPLQANSILELIQGIIGFMWVLAAPISVIMMIYAAFLFMTSAGDPTKLKQAKQALLYTVIGIVIVLISLGGVALIQDILNRLGTP